MYSMLYVLRTALDVNKPTVCRHTGVISSGLTLLWAQVKGQNILRFKNSKRHRSPIHLSARFERQSKDIHAFLFIYFFKEGITANYPFCAKKHWHVEKFNWTQHKSYLVPGSAMRTSSWRRLIADCVLPFQRRFVARSLLGRPGLTYSKTFRTY